MNARHTAARRGLHVHDRTVVLMLALASMACDTTADFPLAPESAPSLTQGQWSPWSAAVPVDGVNTTASEMRAALSKDGTSLYFHSDRPGRGATDLWVSRRDCADCLWETPVNLGDLVNTPDNEGGPALSRDEHWLFFHSNRPGGSGGNDIWASYRSDVHDDLAWGPPVNLGPGVNSAAGESQPSFLENEGGRAHLFFARAGIHMSEMQDDGTWGQAAAIDALAGFNGPSIHPNGLEIYVFRASRIWHASREAPDAPWSAPLALSDLTPGVASVFQPFIHARGGRETLLVGAIPSAGAAPDIYVTTRTR